MGLTMEEEDRAAPQKRSLPLKIITCMKFCQLQYAQDAWYLRKGFSSMKLDASNDSISRD